MKEVNEKTLKELREKGFIGKNCLCEIIDWFFENHQIFISFNWVIDEPANKVDYSFEIDYVWGLTSKSMGEPIKRVYGSRTESQIQSILHAIELI